MQKHTPLAVVISVLIGAGALNYFFLSLSTGYSPSQASVSEIDYTWLALLASIPLLAGLILLLLRQYSLSIRNLAGRHVHYVALLALPLIVVAFAYAEVRQGIPPTDDVVYTYYAHQIAEGDYSVPRPGEINAHYKQRYLVVFPLAFVYRLLGVSFSTSVLYFMMCALIGAFFFYLLLRIIVGEHAALIGAALLTLHPLYLRLAPRVLTEPVMMAVFGAMMCALFVGLHIWWQGRSKVFHHFLFFVAGVCFGLGLSAHLLFSFLVPVLALMAFHMTDKSFSRVAAVGAFFLLGFIVVYIGFSVFTPGLFGSKAATQLSYSSNSMAANPLELFNQIVEYARAKYTLQSLTAGDYHANLFGLFHQLFLLQSRYEGRFSLFHTLLFLIALHYLFTRRDALDPTEHRLCIAVIYGVFLLYILYEFVSFGVVRKLHRYFFYLPFLAILPTAVYLSKTLKPDVAQKYVISIALFLVTLTAGSVFDVDAEPFVFLLITNFLAFLLLLFYDSHESSVHHVIIVLLIAVGLNAINGRLVGGLPGYYKEPMEYVLESSPGPFRIYTSRDAERRGMAPWSLLAQFYTGYDESRLEHRSIADLEELREMEPGYILTKQNLSARFPEVEEVRVFSSGLRLYHN